MGSHEGILIKCEIYEDTMERLMAYREELDPEEIIEERWERLQKEKKMYIPLD